MAKPALKPLTALGGALPLVTVVGGCRIVERFDVALASLATRRNKEKDVVKAAKAAKFVLPDASGSSVSSVYGAFWMSTQQWMIEAPIASHEDIASRLKTLFGEAASITEQTDAWVRLDILSNNLQSLLERLCNVDFPMAGVGFSTRTVIEHLGCYLIKRSEREVTLYGPRSMAQSLLHAIEVTAQSVA